MSIVDLIAACWRAFIISEKDIQAETEVHRSPHRKKQRTICTHRQADTPQPLFCTNVSFNIQEFFFPSQRFKSTIKCNPFCLWRGHSRIQYNNTHNPWGHSPVSPVWKGSSLLIPPAIEVAEKKAICCPKLALIPCNSVPPLVFFLPEKQPYYSLRST